MEIYILRESYVVATTEDNSFITKMTIFRNRTKFLAITVCYLGTKECLKSPVGSHIK